MLRDAIIDFVNDFELEKLTHFFRLKNSSFRHPNEELLFEIEGFSNFLLKEELNFNNINLIVVCVKTNKKLNERSSKKDQYEIAKKILKTQNADAGIFIFYDQEKKFRFSLVYQEYFGRRSRFSFFKRFTYFIDPKKTNKTFIYALEQADFSSLNNLKRAFSVEPVSKEFYKNIQSWYFWALSSDEIFFHNCQSKDNTDKNNKEKAMNLIRLITRLIFIWFIKEKELIPGDLFDEEKLKNIIKDFGRKSNYYNAILQNLFFATLNQEIQKRGWAKNEGWEKNKVNYGIKNLYRYEEKFLINTDQVLELFSKIPFLNGGLFDCLDKDDFGGEIIDGFTRREKYQTKIPDEFFFLDEEKNIDLSSYKLGKRKVRGLIKILQSYNFTTDESTSVDQEIALDPELLGKVFENLLAEYNPETSETARKATGSYYTPREIVDFMVEKSLFYYLKNKVKLNEEELNLLISFAEEKPTLSQNEIKNIIFHLANIKIIDPACGSGAFPMGILLRLIHILNKLDKDNKIWFEIQYQKAIEETERIFKDENQQKEEREKRLKEINEIFDESVNYPDYARKLFLIENCIYGVDIQPIATHISKLRFFISLIIDQEKKPKKENFGIRALPNLDTKFVTANSLIDVQLIDESRKLFKDEEIHNLIDELKEKYHLHFRIKTRNEKKKIQSEIKKIREKIGNLLVTKTKTHTLDTIEEIKKGIEQKKIEIEKIKSDNFSSIKATQNSMFYKEDQLSIDFRKNLIDQKLNELKQLVKKQKELEESLKGDSLEKYAQMIASFDIFDQNVSNSWFNPEWMFGLEEGFDIVIANPPYIQLQKNRGELANLYEPFNFKTFDRMGDIYTLFYEKGLELLKEGGILSYITSNKWMRAGYGEKLRKFLSQFKPLLIIDLGPNVFESATVDTNIIFVKKEKNDQNEINGVELKKEEREKIDQAVEKSDKIIKISPQPWFLGSRIEYRIKEKIEKLGKPLKDWDVKIYYGIKTGLNEAFIITTEKRNEILANCKTEDERKRTEAIIKPILRGRDIKRYYYEWAGLWVIVIPAGWTEENRGNKNPEEFILNYYPSLMNYLKPFEEKAKKRDDKGDYWWELRHCNYYSEFEKEKIVWQELAKGSEFAFDNTEKFYISNTGYILTGIYLRYILGYLNSTLNEFSYEKWYCTKLGKEGIRWLNQHVLNIPIPDFNLSNKYLIKQIEILVNKIVQINKKIKIKDIKLEKEIDKLIYKLYDFSDEEIKFLNSYGKY